MVSFRMLWTVPVLLGLMVGANETGENKAETGGVKCTPPDITGAPEPECDEDSSNCSYACSAGTFDGKDNAVHVNLFCVEGVWATVADNSPAPVACTCGRVKLVAPSQYNSCTNPELPGEELWGCSGPHCAGTGESCRKEGTQELTIRYSGDCDYPEDYTVLSPLKCSCSQPPIPDADGPF